MVRSPVGAEEDGGGRVASFLHSTAALEPDEALAQEKHAEAQRAFFSLSAAADHQPEGYLTLLDSEPWWRRSLQVAPILEAAQGRLCLGVALELPGVSPIEQLPRQVVLRVAHLLQSDQANGEQLRSAAAEVGNAVHVAAHHGRANAIEVLIDAGACVNHPNTMSENGDSPLMAAVRTGGSAEVVALLLAAGADWRHMNHAGSTALSLALQSQAGRCVGGAAANGNQSPSSSSSCAALLESWVIEHGSAVEKAQLRGAQLRQAAIEGDALTAGAMLKSGAVVDTAGVDGTTPLHLAAEFHRCAVVELLLAARADVTATDSDGQTPLLAAVLAGVDSAAAEGTVRALVRAGADINAADGDGLSPFVVAEAEGVRLEQQELEPAGQDSDDAVPSAHTAAEVVPRNGSEVDATAVFEAACKVEACSESSPPSSTATLLYASERSSSWWSWLPPQGLWFGNVRNAF
jgi:ankyrin repeat protein